MGQATGEQRNWWADMYHIIAELARGWSCCTRAYAFSFFAHIGPQADLPGEKCCVFSRTFSPRKNTTLLTYEHRRCEKKRERISPTCCTIRSVRYPMTKVRGLCLASTTWQIRRPSALVSPTDTSWKSCDFTGRSDKTPVLSQNLS